MAWSAVLLVCSAVWPVPADADESRDQRSVQAELRCVPRVGKGRVLCDVDVTVKTGRITWADAIITKVPDFAPPLRDRVSMRDASERSATHLRLPFALIAQQAGEGEVTVKARAVWCKPTAGSGELCTAVTRTATGRVIVTESGS
jgi:hypothetical protein